MIYERRHTRDLAEFGGLASTMPFFAVFFVFTVLSSVGLPGLNGFVGEYMILLGTFQASPFWSIVGVTGVIFGAVYLLKATRRTSHLSVRDPRQPGHRCLLSQLFRRHHDRLHRRRVGRENRHQVHRHLCQPGRPRRGR
jgi:NADH-quinone oxidoreductase subunit M